MESQGKITPEQEQQNQERLEQRRAAYERKHDELQQHCKKCLETTPLSYDRCTYGCTIGKRLRWLEAEYGDITGWRHERWNSK